MAGSDIRGPSCEHQGVHPIALAAGGAGTSHTAAAVAVVLVIIGIWRLAVGGRGEVKLRLIAWVLLPLIVWGMIAVHDPAEAGRIAAGAASGTSVAASAFGQLLTSI
jgi:hypothetical protein